MSLPPHIQDAMDRRVGACLIAAAVDVQSETKRALSTSFPPASKLGQYPHGRTWNLREGVVYGPTDPLVVGRQRFVRIGYTQAAFYGGILELFRGRLGIVATVKRIRSRVNAWVAAARRAGGGG